jgi:hypothetical protein
VPKSTKPNSSATGTNGKTNKNSPRKSTKKAKPTSNSHSLYPSAPMSTSTSLMEIGPSMKLPPSSPTSLVLWTITSRYQSIFIQVHPKKTFVELLEKKNDIKITSNISIEGLKIVGSWDNWK